MPHDRLQPLWRPAEMGNEQARGRVAERMKRVLRPLHRSALPVDSAGLDADPVLDQQWDPAAAPNREVALDAANFIREYQTGLARRALCPPLLQRVHDQWGERN